MDNAVVVPTGAGALADQAATRQPFYSMITSFMAHLHQPQQPAHRDVFCGHLTDWIKLLRATCPLLVKSSRPVSAALNVRISCYEQYLMSSHAIRSASSKIAR